MMPRPLTAEARSLDHSVVLFPRGTRIRPASEGGEADGQRSGLFHIVLLPLAIAVPSFALLALLMGAFLVILSLVGLLATAIIICELIRKYMQHRAKLAAFNSRSMGYPGRSR